MVESSNRGAQIHWIVVAVMLVGFTVGGIALIFWNWWFVGIGAIVFVVGGAVGMASGIMEQVH